MKSVETKTQDNTNIYGTKKEKNPSRRLGRHNQRARRKTKIILSEKPGDREFKEESSGQCLTLQIKSEQGPLHLVLRGH